MSVRVTTSSWTTTWGGQKPAVAGAVYTSTARTAELEQPSWGTEMTDEEDFSKYPPSINEIKADRSESSQDWTPRDALIRCLRDLDSGKISPDALIILHHKVEEDGIVKTDFYAAGTLVQVAATIELGKNRYFSMAEHGH